MDKTKERDLSSLTLNERINCISVELQASNLKKSGRNKHAGFDYFELSDFLPILNTLMRIYQVNSIFTVHDNYARLILQHKELQQEYLLPYHDFEVPVTKSGSQMMQPIQYLGAINTYYKRYLYMNAFHITDGDVIDSLDNSEIKKPEMHPNHEGWEEAKRFMDEGGDIKRITKKYTLTKENEKLLLS